MQISHPIMLIRHAEKPLREPRDQEDGVGSRGRHGLSPRGEQRAVLLASYFAPAGGNLRDGQVRTPEFIFAASTTDQHSSTRPADTVRPLATSLGLDVQEKFSSDAPFDAAARAMTLAASHGPVLASWRYDTLPDLARAIGARDVPAEWPANRFDMTWVLRHTDGEWRLEQVPQRLMPEDSGDPIGG